MMDKNGKWVSPDSTLICGVDEVGRGSLAGPVAAGAVIFRRNYKLDGINDSKKLSPARRLEMYPAILENSISAGVGYVDPPIIDRRGINFAVTLAMYRAIRSLKIVPDWILVDGFIIPDIPISQTALQKGDSLSESIGAASIIAKVLRDRVMEFYDCIYPEYGFAKNKGYGTTAHIEAIKKYGPCPIHRKTFAPINEIQG